MILERIALGVTVLVSPANAQAAAPASTPSPVREIVVLRDPDCGSGVGERIQKLADRHRIRIIVREVVISTEADIAKHRFLGSPTVQINGKDIDPKVRDSKAFGFS